MIPLLTAGWERDGEAESHLADDMRRESPNARLDKTVEQIGNRSGNLSSVCSEKSVRKIFGKSVGNKVKNGSGIHTQLAKMSLDKIFDLTAGVYFNFYDIQAGKRSRTQSGNQWVTWSMCDRDMHFGMVESTTENAGWRQQQRTVKK